MDKTVPQRAAHILKQIYVLEARSNYETISSFKQHLLRTPITKLTLRELLVEMPTWRKRFGTLSSAAGAPQIIEKTLRGLITELKLNLNQKYDANLQDRLAYHLLRRRGYDAWVNGKITDTEFAKRLAQEWASLPVLRNGTQGAHRKLNRGESYYAGDGLNGTKYPASAFEQLLEDAKGLPAGVDVANKPVVGKVIGGTVVGGAIGVGVTENIDTVVQSGQSILDSANGVIGLLVAGSTAAARLVNEVPTWTLAGAGLVLAGYLGYRLWSKHKAK